MEPVTVLVGLCMGLALAATCGLRAFLPLFVVSLLAYWGRIDLSEGYTWLAEPVAVLGLGVAVTAEILADKIPVVDHVLDGVSVVVKPLAAMVAAASVMTELDPALSTVVGLVLGGSMAQGVHLVKAKLRVLSTTLTAGVASPFLSILEDAIAVITAVLALLLPMLAFSLAVAASILGYRAWLKRRRSRHESPTR